MKKFLLNIYLWPMFAIINLMSYVVILPLILLINAVLVRRPIDVVLRKSVRIYGWVLVRVIPFMAPIKVEDRSGGFATPVIFAANHYSSVDPYLFGLLPYEMAFVTSWPFRIPFYNWVMRLAHYIDATEGWDEVEKQGSKLLDRGCSLILWPEGHRSRDGKLRRFKNGAFHLACRSGYPVVPVCIVGTFKLLPPGKRLITPASVKMIILPPILPEGTDTSAQQVKILKDRVKKAIASELESPRAGGKEATPAEGQLESGYSTVHSTR